jgi:peptidoglycan/xylan/chitin deacetylase (PgdA/CDA1 family)
MTGAVKRLARIGLHQLGGLRPLFWRSRNKFRILTYHRFATNLYPSVEADLKRQCAFLRRHFEIVSLAEIGQSLQSGRKLPPNALAVTIDDGYRDFLLDAFPVFREWKIPATIYLITDFLDGKLWPWWNQVEYAVMHTTLASVTVALIPAGSPQTLHLGSREQKEHAVTSICAQVVRIPNQDRLNLLRVLPELFQVDLPGKAPAEYSPLTWDEVRFLAEAGIEFGAHTKTHPILPSLKDPESIHQEIAGSKDRIEQELGRAALHFCYPNGDFNDAALQSVERCGFQTAVTTRSGMNAPGEPRYTLKRLSVEPGQFDDYFREQLAGLHS